MIHYISFISETIIFALYIFICLILTKPRFSRTVIIPVYAGVILLSAAAMAALTLSGHQTTALTLIPLIAYLPFSVCLYIMSDSSIFESVSACSIGILSALIVKTSKKLSIRFYSGQNINGLKYDIFIGASVLVIALIMAFAVYRLMRKSFRECVDAGRQNQLLILIPASVLILLIFYNLNTTYPTALLILSLAATVSFFALAVRLFNYQAKIAEAEKNERILFESLEQQRRDLETIYQNVEAGRRYRHDMRHHLKVLSGMAKQDNAAEISGYIDNLSAAAELCEPELFCKNPAINAVASEYLSRAKNLGCEINSKILIPKEIPFDLPDVCIILSNALENALNACEKCPENERRIDLTADFSDGKKLIVSVSNNCHKEAKIDADGLPVITRHEDGHGIGLRSVKKITEKYNGFLLCECQNNIFSFHAVIFCEPDVNGAPADGNVSKNKRSKILPAVLTLLICSIGLLNVSPAAADALSDALSIDIKTISYGWGDNKFNAKSPEFSGDNSDKLNQTATDFIEEANDIFWKYAIQKYEGYVSEDSGYQIMLDNEKYLSIRFYATLNAGGSVDYSRCVTIDKLADKELALSDLFEENYDYIGVISAEVLRQMQSRVENEKAAYYLPGGIWRDEDCFKEISPQQNFYINSNGKLVIAFNEYEVAPGSMGCPEFEMPDDIFSLKTE